MSRTPHSRTQPPAPKERPVSLAVSGSPRLTPASPEQAEAQTGDMIAFWVFVVLIALGLLAATRAFLMM